MQIETSARTRKDSISSIISNSISVKQQILEDEDLMSRISTAADIIAGAFESGHKVFFCGNGGSAADAQHLAAEFSGRFYKDRDPLPSEALHVNTSYLTAVANDYGYEFVFSRLLKGIAGKGDVLVGLSTSGRSKNIIEAFRKAQEIGVTSIGFTGAVGGSMGDLSSVLINIPSSDTPRIQESHILVGHIICEIVEAELFTDK